MRHREIVIASHAVTVRPSDLLEGWQKLMKRSRSRSGFWKSVADLIIISI
jgi:hypothetical protein